MIVNSFSSLFLQLAVGSIHFLRWASGQHFSSVQCSYSRQQRSLTTSNAQRARSRHAVFSQTSTLHADAHPSSLALLDQVTRPGAYVLRPHGWKLNRIPPRPLKWVLRGGLCMWLDSCLVIELPVTLKASPRDDSTPSLPHMRHSVKLQKQGTPLLRSQATWHSSRTFMCNVFMNIFTSAFNFE